VRGRGGGGGGGGGGRGGGSTIYPGLTMLHMYLSLLQKKPYTSSLSHSATQGQSFRFNVKIFSWPTLAWGPKPTVGDLDYRKYKEFKSYACNCLVLHH
jgi:hypothetical protein